MNIRNRIVEFRTVAPDEVAPNARNWRTHPQAQRDALRGVLADVGIAAPVLAYHSARADGALVLIDGHERMTVGVPFPCAILDVSDEEADKLLATFDPLTAMAETDTAALDALLRDVSTDSPAVAQMLAELAESAGMVVADEGEPVDPADLWKGMPEFEQEDASDKYKSLIVHFETEDDYQAFARLVGQNLTPQTKWMWHPFKPSHGVRGSMQGYTTEDES